MCKTRKLLAIIGILLFHSYLVAQDQLPSFGDTDLSADDVRILSESVYVEPNYDGAILPPQFADLSVDEGWRLAIRFQGRQESCQSFAVAYAADILEHRADQHSEQYVWDSLCHRRLQNSADQDLPGYRGCTMSVNNCLTCRYGSNLINALSEARQGIPSRAQYGTTNRCGLVAPSFNLEGTSKFRFRVLWWDKNKQPSGLGFPQNNFSVSELTTKIKEQLTLGTPVLVSICASAFTGYQSGVHTENPTRCENGRGWHAMTIVGYDDRLANGVGAFKIANSWNNPYLPEAPWGDNGYLKISYPAFRELVRFAAIMSIDLDNAVLEWKPANIKKNPDGTDQELQENSRINIFQFELNQHANGDIPVCLDANEWYSDGRDPNPVIVYECQRSQLKKKNNQKWELWLKEKKEGENYYVLRSMAKSFAGKVLAIREKRLVLEDESESFDENQRWIVRWAPKSADPTQVRSRVIVWAGMGGEYTLQTDLDTLLNYSRTKTTMPFILQGFTNSPNQTWRFRAAFPVAEK